MSGRKNHHVPQLLQRGFGFRKKKTVQVWVYSKDKRPFLTSTANFGAERDFYIQEQDRLVDDLVTDFEGSINDFIKALRARDEGALLDRVKISLILAHLEMRSKFVRDELSFVSETLVKELRRYLSKPENIVRFVKRAIADDPDIIGKEIDKLKLNEEQRSLADAWIAANLDAEIANKSSKLLSCFEPAFNVFVDELSATVKNGHLKALAKNDSETPRSLAYTNLKYEVLFFDKESVILPDSMVCFLKDDGSVTPFLDKSDTLSEVYFPLSSFTLLYGYRGIPDYRPISTINRLLASCSSINFIAHDDQPWLHALTNRIGKNARMISSAEMQKIIREAVKLK